MSEAEKMRPTEPLTLTLERKGHKPRVFRISATLGKQVEQLVKSRGEPAKGTGASVVIPELGDATLRPAISLRGSRHKAGMTQAALAEQLGIRQAHISAMEHGKRPIGKKMAARLAGIFACDYRVFL